MNQYRDETPSQDDVLSANVAIVRRVAEKQQLSYTEAALTMLMGIMSAVHDTMRRDPTVTADMHEAVRLSLKQLRKESEGDWDV